MDFFGKKDLIYLIILWILTLTAVFFAAKYHALKRSGDYENITLSLPLREKGDHFEEMVDEVFCA